MTGGLMLCDDLMFTSKVTATARAQGLSVVAVRSSPQVLAKAQESPPACVIVDLHNANLNLSALLTDLRATCPTMPRVIAYGSHVDTVALKAARQAGCDEVMPRSRFVASLEADLAKWLGS